MCGLQCIVKTVETDVVKEEQKEIVADPVLKNDLPKKKPTTHDSGKPSSAVCQCFVHSCLGITFMFNAHDSYVMKKEIPELQLWKYASKIYWDGRS